MNCRFCDSELTFEPAEDGFPNVLKCPCCSWFYEWHPNQFIGGSLTREQVENALKRYSDDQWIELHAKRLVIAET